MTAEEFIEKLQQYSSPQVFNPWADYDTECDIGPQAPVIRAANFLRYLKLRQNAHFLFIAEGLGYQGGHFSGMAMTSERICSAIIRMLSRRQFWVSGITSVPAIRTARA